jgi:hypothetical protein
MDLPKMTLENFYTSTESEKIELIVNYPRQQILK